MRMLIICEIVNKRYSFSVVAQNNEKCVKKSKKNGNDSNLLIVFYVQIMPDDFVMQLHRF